jgi:hypothetical protein
MDFNWLLRHLRLSVFPRLESRSKTMSNSRRRRKDCQGARHFAPRSYSDPGPQGCAHVGLSARGPRGSWGQGVDSPLGVAVAAESARAVCHRRFESDPVDVPIRPFDLVRLAGRDNPNAKFPVGCVRQLQPVDKRWFRTFQNGLAAVIALLICAACSAKRVAILAASQISRLVRCGIRKSLENDISDSQPPGR